MKTVVLQALLLIVLAMSLAVLPPYGVDPGTLLNGCAVAVAVICLWCFVSWRLSGGRLFEPYSLFLMAAVCFNAGHIALFAAGVDIPSSFIAHFSTETSLKTMIAVAVGLSSFHFGGLLAKMRRNKTHTDGFIGPDRQVRLGAVALVGVVLFAISFPAWLYVTYGRIGRVMQYGYFVANFGNTSTGMAHLPELLAEALAPALMFVVAGSKIRVAIRWGAVLTMVVFGATTLFAGNKGPVVMALLAFGWVWHRIVRPLRGVLLTVSAIALAIFVIPLTTAIREVAGHDRTSVTAVENAYSGITNPAVAFLSETGWTATTVAHTIELVPAVREYDYGRSYMYAAMAVVPNVGGGLHPSKEHGFLADWLVSTLAPEYAARGGGWGFSFIAEAYANFGSYGMPVALIVIGYLFGILFAWEQASMDPARTAMIGACLCNCLLYARGESGLLLREIVWYALIPYLCVELLSKRRVRRQQFSHGEITPASTELSRSQG
jgi:oligosaccharide repeat unit polymerase